MMKSCIYEGEVRHRRTTPVAHSFRYRLFMMCLDLAELPNVFDGIPFWSVERPGLARFRRADHMKELQSAGKLPLDEAVRRLVEQRIGRRPTGSIRLLTQLAYFGYRFNPVSFYFCMNEADASPDVIVAEINNTPWGEQHCYVLDCRMRPESRRRFRFAKAFHVSPFMDMSIEHDWRFSAPGCLLAVRMKNIEAERQIFDATMVLRRREIGRGALASVLFRYPFMTARIIGAIYYQAFRLWSKGCPFFSHPKVKSPETGGA